MKLKLICMCFCLLLLFSGCGSANDVNNGTEGGNATVSPEVTSAKKTTSPEETITPEETAQPEGDVTTTPEVTAAPKKTTEPTKLLTPAPALDTQLPKPIADGSKTGSETAISFITDNAPKMSILAVLTDPNAKTYKALGVPVREMEASIDAWNPPDETLLFTPLQDNVQILVEEVEYHPNLNWFYVTKTLYDFQAKAGEHYALKTHLPEGVPHIRITAVWGGRQLSWYCAYDGRGDQDIEEAYYLSFSYEYELWFEYDAPYSVNISGSAAVNHMLFGENGFWETVIQAASLLEETGSRPVMLSQERFFEYVEAIHPGLTAWPEMIDEIQYSERDNTYIFDPYDNDAIATWELSHVTVIDDDSTSGGSVWIDVTCPNFDEFPVLFEVVWRLSKNAGESPFKFCITDVILHEAMG